MSDTFTYYQDPAHGWIEVPRELLAGLGISHLITSYSYTNGELAYLEEDQDATTFIRAYRAQFFTSPELHEVHQRHTPIRRYTRYQV